MHMVYGSQYIWGNISIYCLSYFYQHDRHGIIEHSSHEPMSKYYNVIQMGLPILSLTTSFLSMPLSSVVFNKLSQSRLSKYLAAEKLQIILACIICVLGVLVSTSETYQNLA